MEEEKGRDPLASNHNNNKINNQEILRFFVVAHPLNAQWARTGGAGQKGGGAGLKRGWVSETVGEFMG